MAYDASFKPGIIGHRFKQWAHWGIATMLIDKGEIKSFQNFKNQIFHYCLVGDCVERKMWITVMYSG